MGIYNFDPFEDYTVSEVQTSLVDHMIAVVVVLAVVVENHNYSGIFAEMGVDVIATVNSVLVLGLGFVDLERIFVAVYLVT